jgi:xanthine/uracil/vitamin C permease (AzgA family)
VHWADATTTAINMYRLLPVLTQWVKPVDFWALILSSAVVSSTVSHYIHSDSLVPSFGASGIMAAVNTFLFMHVPDEFTTAAAPGVLAYLYRYRMQYFNTLMKADEEGKELADFSLPDFNFTTQIVRELFCNSQPLVSH